MVLDQKKTTTLKTILSPALNISINLLHLTVFTCFSHLSITQKIYLFWECAEEKNLAKISSLDLVWEGFEMVPALSFKSSVYCGL